MVAFLIKIFITYEKYFTFHTTYSIPFLLPTVQASAPLISWSAVQSLTHAPYKMCGGFFRLLYKAAVPPERRQTLLCFTHTVRLNKDACPSTRVALLISSPAGFGIAVLWTSSRLKDCAPKGTVSVHEVDGCARWKCGSQTFEEIRNVHKYERHHILLQKISCLFEFNPPPAPPNPLLPLISI